ncbi:ABC transporter permease [bacterium]|nr:ABC transporter permease [bacterium]
MTLNLFRYFTLPHFYREKGNNLLTITGICLGVAVFVAIEIANQSTLASFKKSFDSIAGKSTIQIDGGETGVHEGVMTALMDVPGVILAAPVVQAYPMIGETGGEIILVQGVDLLREDKVREYKTEKDYKRDSVDNAKPLHSPKQTAERSLEEKQDHTSLNSDDSKLSASGDTQLKGLIDPDTIAISRSFAQRNGLKTGDSLMLKYNQSEREMVIKAILEDEGPALAMGGNFAIMDIANAQEAFDKIGYLDRIDIVSSSDFSVEEVIRNIKTRISPGLDVKRPEMRNRQIENIIASFQINLRILSYIAILVGIFLIYNTLGASVEKRRQEVAILRSLGASKAQIYGMILQEATILGLIGSSIGVALGLALAKSALSLVSRTVTSIYLLTAVNEITLTRGTVALSMFIGIACTVLSSFIPARRASRIRPHIVIGMYASNSENRPTASLWRYGFLSILFFIVAVTFYRAGMSRSNPASGYAAALFTILGFTCITPGFTNALVRLLGPVIERIFGIPGKFSIQNILRSISRVSVTTAALMASLAMLISIAIMVESFRETVYMWTVQTLKADLYITTTIRFARGTDDRLRAQVRDIVEGIKGVAQTGPYRFININYGESKIGLASNDFEVFKKQGGIWFKSGDVQKILEEARAKDGVLISENMELKYGLKHGDSVTLDTPSGIMSFLIYGIYYDYSNDLGVVLMDTGLYKRVWKEDYISTLGVFLEKGAGIEDVASNIKKALGASDYLLVMRGQELRDRAMSTFRQTFLIFFALEIIAMLVALLGITNSLMISVMHRQREIAVLRSIGATKGQIQRMIVIEAATMGLTGNILGIFAGVSVSLIMIFVITRQSFGWSIKYNLHLPNLVMSIGPVLLVSVLAGYIPARKAAGIPLAEGLRYE